jgi:DNA-binding XRE family transcriptional regulator
MMLADVRKIDGEKVRIARDKAFLSQGELAEKAGVNRNTINRIEKGGVVQVHPRTIRKVAKALVIDPASLTPKEE